MTALAALLEGVGGVKTTTDSQRTVPDDALEFPSGPRGELTTMATPKVDTLSLFSGMGGLDLGAQLAGLQVGLAVDRDERALKTLQAGLGTRTAVLDSSTCEATQLVDPFIDPSDVRYVIGGPPCTAFSHAGFWIDSKREGDDPAANCLDDFCRIVRELEPAAFCLENVPGLTFKTHRQRLESVVARMRRAGYSVSWEILSASDFGVAQKRRRLFVVGVYGGPRFKFPEPGDAVRSAAWAIEDLSDKRDHSEPDEVPRGRWADLIPLVPEGGNYLHFTSRNGWTPPLFKWRGRYWTFLLKLDPETASPTLSAQRVTFNGPFHWDNRHLRRRELARLQGFPDWFPLPDDLPAARRQIGNAVPPPLAAAVLWKLRQHIGDADATAPAVLEISADPDASVQDVMNSMSPRSENGAPSK